MTVYVIEKSRLINLVLDLTLPPSPIDASTSSQARAAIAAKFDSMNVECFSAQTFDPLLTVDQEIRAAAASAAGASWAGVEVDPVNMSRGTAVIETAKRIERYIREGQ